MKIRILCAACMVLSGLMPVAGQPVQLSLSQNGQLVWTNTSTNEVVYTVEWLASVTNNNWKSSWDSLQNIRPSSNMVVVDVPMVYRVRSFEYLDTTNEAVLWMAYSNAIADARAATPAKISTGLTPVTQWNTNLAWRTNSLGSVEVKVASLMKKATAEQYYPIGLTNLSYGDQWVTVYPELKQACGNYHGSNPLLRIRQVLGMPYDTSSDTVVEYWVCPEFLVRPAPDPEINDSTAGLVSNPNSPYMTGWTNMLTGTNVTTNLYVGWFNATYDSRNYEMKNLTNGWQAWPWTRLGYTYDWGASTPNHFGLSEFVIPSGTIYKQQSIKVPIEVVAIIPASQYGRNDGQGLARK